MRQYRKFGSLTVSDAARGIFPRAASVLFVFRRVACCLLTRHTAGDCTYTTQVQSPKGAGRERIKWSRYAQKALLGQGNPIFAQHRVRLVSWLGAVLWFTSGGPAQTVQSPPQQPAPVPPAAVLAPAILEEFPPSAPTVTYENGVLTISAYNSTLSDILLGIHSQTGADVDIPPQTMERVVTRLGPGPARDVVQSLLRGSRFNYVIVGSTADPNAIARVLLFAKPTAESAPHPVMNSADTVPHLRFKHNENNIVAEEMQPEWNSQEPAPPVRAWQQMLQQRGQMVMEEFQRNRRPSGARTP